MTGNPVGPEPREFGPVSQTDIVRFAGAGGDFNPLHHDPERARAAGFDAPIAMGQLTAGLLAAWLTDWCGVERLRRFEVRFVAPLRIGDTLTMSGAVISIGDDGSLEVEVTAVGPEGPVVTGSARVSR